MSHRLSETKQLLEMGRAQNETLDINIPQQNGKRIKDAREQWASTRFKNTTKFSHFLQDVEPNSVPIQDSAQRCPNR